MAKGIPLLPSLKEEDRGHEMSGGHFVSHRILESITMGANPLESVNGYHVMTFTLVICMSVPSFVRYNIPYEKHFSDRYRRGKIQYGLVSDTQKPTRTGKAKPGRKPKQTRDKI